jgi:hypothetical protein
MLITKIKWNLPELHKILQPLYLKFFLRNIHVNN